MTFGGRSRLPVGAGVVVALVFAVTACGGGGKNETTSTSEASATVQWASGVCTAFTKWKTSLESIRSSFKGGGVPSRSDLERAGNEVRDATETLTQTLKALGRPKTASGEAAKQDIDTLTTVLTNDKNKIEETLKAKPANAAAALQQISTVTATVAAMAHNLNLAIGNLKRFEPSGELEKAFHEAPSCSPYFSS